MFALRLDTKLIVAALLAALVLATGVGLWIYVATLHARLEGDEWRLAQAQAREHALEAQAAAAAQALAEARRMAELAQREQRELNHAHAVFDRDRARNRKVLANGNGVSLPPISPAASPVDVRPVWRRLNELFLCDPADSDSDQTAASGVPGARAPGIRAD